MTFYQGTLDCLCGMILHPSHVMRKVKLFMLLNNISVHLNNSKIQKLIVIHALDT